MRGFDHAAILIPRHNDPLLSLEYPQKNALQIMSLAAYASEINIICEFEMNVKKYFYWRSNISYHSNDTPPHYQEKFMSFSEYNSFSVTCPNLPAAALVILITEAADVWGRKDW